jgi:hypothetical protein
MRIIKINSLLYVSVVVLACCSFTWVSADCITTDQTLYNQQIGQLTAGKNGVGQTVAYFRVAGTGNGSGCDHTFAIDDLGKIYYSALLSALTTGAKVDFWATGTADTYVPGDGANRTGHSAATINIRK